MLKELLKSKSAPASKDELTIAREQEAAASETVRRLEGRRAALIHQRELADHQRRDNAVEAEFAGLAGEAHTKTAEKVLLRDEAIRKIQQLDIEIQSVEDALGVAKQNHAPLKARKDALEQQVAARHIEAAKDAALKDGMDAISQVHELLMTAQLALGKEFAEACDKLDVLEAPHQRAQLMEELNQRLSFFLLISNHGWTKPRQLERTFTIWALIPPK